jgi:dynein heavy chain 1
LNSKIESILAKRLDTAVKLWISSFENKGHHKDTATESFTVLEFPMLQYELKLKNQAIYLDPPLETVRITWIDHLHEWMSNVCQLERIRNVCYERNSATSNPDSTCFRSLVISIRLWTH